MSSKPLNNFLALKKSKFSSILLKELNSNGTTFVESNFRNLDEKLIYSLSYCESNTENKSSDRGLLIQRHLDEKSKIMSVHLNPEEEQAEIAPSHVLTLEETLKKFNRIQLELLQGFKKCDLVMDKFIKEFEELEEENMLLKAIISKGSNRAFTNPQIESILKKSISMQRGSLGRKRKAIDKGTQYEKEEEKTVVDLGAEKQVQTSFEDMSLMPSKDFLFTLVPPPPPAACLSQPAASRPPASIDENGVNVETAQKQKSPKLANLIEPRTFTLMRKLTRIVKRIESISTASQQCGSDQVSVDTFLGS